MFLKKKKKEPVKPFTPLYIRISSLFNDINTNKCDIYMSDKTEFFNVTEFYSNCKTIEFSFNSNNGPINFSIKMSSREFNNYTIRYINEQTRWMFEIYCRPHWTVVQPDLGKNILAKDIDLALLEIEKFVEDINIKNISNYNIHKQELEKLQNLDFSKG